MQNLFETQNQTQLTQSDQKKLLELIQKQIVSFNKLQARDIKRNKDELLRDHLAYTALPLSSE